MKKVLSVLLAVVLLTSMLTVAVNALSLSDEGMISAAEGVKAYEEATGEEVETQRIYFQMPNGNRGGVASEDILVHRQETDPETGEIIKEYDEVVLHAGEKALSWYSDYDIVDGKHYAGAYWWGGSANPATYSNDWCGYRMEIDDYDQGIYYVDIPKDVVIMNFNNGVDGGTDSAKPIYFEAAQTVNTNIEGAYEGDYDTLPYGSPDEDYFDGCILIIDPNQVSINGFSNKQECGGNWYVYYGNGCYGEEFKGGTSYDETPGWSENVADICKNPDHFVNGVHVGYHEEVPTEPTQPTEPADWGLLGDIDNSGEVDIVDVTFIQRAVLGIIKADEGMQHRGDVDGDGDLEITDATLIQRWLLGLEQNRGIGTAAK